MGTMFLVCAIVGGTLVVCQFALTLLGFAGHGDVHGGDVHVGDFHGGDLHAGDVHAGDAHTGDHQSGQTQQGSHTNHSGARLAGKSLGPRASVAPSGSAANWFFSVLSFRTVVAAVALFGFAGKAAMGAGFDSTTTLVIAAAAGVAAMYAVHALMTALHSLDTDRTVRIERAVGQPGTVYLSIPARRSGSGKIHLTLQNRLDELEAVTSGERLPGGAKVKVVAIIGPGTVEVEAVA